MKFTLSWLKDHLDTAASCEDLATKLSAIGLDVESIEQPARALEPFTIARVIEAKRHPNADKLQICTVDTGSSIVEVVCGAPNAKTGMIGVFAPIGSYIPGTKITLDKRPVRGVVSNGMLVSENELELSEDHTGIIELSGDFASRIGERYIDVLGLGDPVFEVKLTPNRPDCTGVRGIARDLAAAGMGKFKPERTITGVEGTFDCPVAIKLDFPQDARAACPCFAGRYLRGVNNGVSPAWMQRRLKAIGLRPINALVDVTNYISMDRGRPLHVYDADKLSGAIRARLGRAGESFRGLDGKTHAVDATMCVIADERAVLGLGGILGGEDTGCTTATKNVLIECAYFDPLRTAATGRTLGLQSDARYRFERGVDPAFVRPGLDLATAMMLDVAGGTPSKARVAGTPPSAERAIDFSFGSVAKLGGLTLAPEQIRATLQALGFVVDGTGTAAKVAPPSWRPDVHGSADLVEEVVRIAGLDTVPAKAMARASGVARPVLTHAQRRQRHARRVLAARGLVEAITWSFVARDTARHFGGGQDELELANAISSEMTSMRPSLLPGLLAAVARNRNRGFADVALFEVGQAYCGATPKDQFMVASGVRCGAATLTGRGRHWSVATGNAGLFDAKSDVLAILAGLGFDAGRAQLARDAPSWFHPGRSATLRLGPKAVLAQFGELHPDTLRAVDISAPTAVFEVFLDALPAGRRVLSRRALVAADLLPVHRDFAFLLPKDVAAGDVIKATLAVDRKLIVAASVFDLFEGPSLGDGMKSLGLEVTLQPTERTLREEEIEALAAKIIAAVRQATGGEIRS
jgi:phenylalanyl-tRNA synthetase beta chain